MSVNGIQSSQPTYTSTTTKATEKKTAEKKNTEAGLEYRRRACLFLDDAAHCVERINAERKNENRKWRNQ